MLSNVYMSRPLLVTCDNHFPYLMEAEGEDWIDGATCLDRTVDGTAFALFPGSYLSVRSSARLSDGWGYGPHRLSPELCESPVMCVPMMCDSPVMMGDSPVMCESEDVGAKTAHGRGSPARGGVETPWLRHPHGPPTSSGTS